MKIPLRTKYTRKLALVMLLCSACNTASRAPSAQTLIRQQRKTVDGVPRLVVVPENVRAAKRASTANHTSVAPELVRAQLLSALIEYDNFFVLDPEEVTAGDLRKTPAPGTKGPFLIAVRVTEMSAKVEEDGTSFNMIKKRDTLAEEIMQVYAGFPLFLFGFYTGLPSAWQEETVKSIVGIDLSLTRASNGEILSSVSAQGTYAKSFVELRGGLSSKSSAQSVFEGALREAIREGSGKLLESCKLLQREGRL